MRGIIFAEKGKGGGTRTAGMKMGKKHNIVGGMMGSPAKVLGNRPKLPMQPAIMPKMAAPAARRMAPKGGTIKAAAPTRRTTKRTMY